MVSGPGQLPGPALAGQPLLASTLTPGRPPPHLAVQQGWR
jgi:hypothetical protein